MTDFVWFRTSIFPEYSGIVLKITGICNAAVWRDSKHSLTQASHSPKTFDRPKVGNSGGSTFKSDDRAQVVEKVAFSAIKCLLKQKSERGFTTDWYPLAPMRAATAFLKILLGLLWARMEAKATDTKSAAR